MKVAIVAAVIIVCLGLVCLPGCVKTTRVVTDKDGKVTEETTSWEPIVVSAPVMVRTYPEYYPSPVVVYERPYYPYYRSRYVYPQPAYYGRTVFMGSHRYGWYHHHRR